MTLKRLRLRNFKGIRDFELRADDKSVSVYGANESGKSSVADAFTWLLFGKDMQDRTETKFGIKTRENGRVVHHLEHEVSATFEHDSRVFSLRRVYLETWSRKRGTDKDELTGHTTNYFIDDAPVSKSEYTSFIASICDESKFKMLTVPNYFAETLEWKERRAILSQIVGDIDDLAVIASDDSLASYLRVKANLSHDQAKARVRDQMKLRREQLELLPARIDEAQRQIVEIEDSDLLDVRKERALKEIAELRAVIETPKTAPIESPHAVEIRLTREKHDEVSARRRAEYMAWVDTRSAITKSYRDEIARFDEKRAELAREQVKLVSETKTAQIELDAQIARRDALDKEHDWLAETCPACKQALPKEELDSARHAFAEQKKTLNATIAQLSARVNDKNVAKKIAELTKQIEQIEAETKQLEADRDKHLATVFDESEFADELAALEARLDELRKLNDDFLSKLTADAPTYEAERAKIDELSVIVQHVDRQKAQIDMNEKIRARVEELSILRQQTSAELVDLERDLYTLESFERVKSEMMTKSVNQLFNGVEFILFRDFISGGLEPCCDVVYKGVPYSEGLNTAGRAQAGIEIINVLSKEFGLTMPIIVDNRESVTRLPESESQIISLIVSPEHKNLTVS